MPYDVLQCVTMYHMARETVTVRIPSETREALDAIAATLDRDRSHVVNEALAAYIETHRWQLEHIHQGFRQARSGRFVPEPEADKRIARLRRK